MASERNATPGAVLIRDEPAWTYPGFGGRPSRRRLRVWRVGPGRLVAVLTEGMTDVGTSITNAAEAVSAAIAADYPDDVVEVVEHYPASPRAGDVYDGVELVDGEPQWRPIPVGDLVARLGPGLLGGAG